MFRNRALALAGVGLLLAAMRSCALDSGPRAWLVLVALPLGYGHLLGAALFASGRRGAAAVSPLASVRGALGVLNLLGAYLWALRIPALRGAVLAPMLLISAWHIAENDLALGRSYREGLRLGPVPRGPRPHALALTLAAGMGLLALTTPAGAQFSMRELGGRVAPLQRAFSLDELATAVLMYHALSWILFFESRARALPRRPARRLRARLGWLHAIPLALNALLYCLLPALHVYAASPALYLFWSLLHALHTARRRGLEPARAPRTAWATR